MHFTEVLRIGAGDHPCGDLRVREGVLEIMQAGEPEEWERLTLMDAKYLPLEGWELVPADSRFVGER